MAMMYEFNMEFIERTRDILNCYYDNTEYEVTLLLNCLLALVTLPIERKKVIEDEKTQTFQNDCIKKLDELKNDYKDMIFDKHDSHTFNHIRNSIAHLHIVLEKSSYEDKIQNIILKDAINFEHFKNKDYNFVISISVDKLKEFAMYVSDKYIKTFFIMDSDSKK